MGRADVAVGGVEVLGAVTNVETGKETETETETLAEHKTKDDGVTTMAKDVWETIDDTIILTETNKWTEIHATKETETETGLEVDMVTGAGLVIITQTNASRNRNRNRNVRK